MSIFYSPENYGLTVVNSIDYSDGSYVFDTRIVWTDGDKFYTARDSGCSCPEPFEDYHSIADLEVLTDWTQLRDEVLSGGGDSCYAANNMSELEKQEFLDSIRRAMK